MASSNPLPGTLRRAISLAAAAILLVGWVGVAGAQGRAVTGEDILEVVDTDKMTLQLDDMLVRVTDDTRIYDGDEKRIKFESIPDPTKSPVVVEYSGTRSGKDEIIARRLVVKIVPR